MNFAWLAGPYAPYILPSYAIALVVCVYVALAPVVSGNKQRRQLAARIKTRINDDTNS